MSNVAVTEQTLGEGAIAHTVPVAPTVTIPDISDARLDALAAEINRTGFGVIPNMIAPEDLARMQTFVTEGVIKANRQYAGFIGPDAVAGSGLDSLGHSPIFRSLLDRVYQRGTGQAPPQQEHYQLLRCLAGSSARVHSYFFHYDSYVVTMLVPICIPTSGQTGDLLMLPNTRRIRSGYLANVIDKILLDNRATQWALRNLMKLGILKFTRVKMVPGNAYFFWGYRSIHGNEPCDPDQVRATALFHLGNPHHGHSKANARGLLGLLARAR